MGDAPRVTPADLEANIKSEHYFTAYEGVHGERFLHQKGEIEDPKGKIPDPLRLLTICVLVLQNDFTVSGVSACASPENFDEALGRQIARNNAAENIWPLMGYELRTKLYNRAEPSTSNPSSGVQASGRSPDRSEAKGEGEGHDAVGTGPAETAIAQQLDNLIPEPSPFKKKIVGDRSAANVSDPFNQGDS